jgi:hypothetical protein
VDGRYVVDNGAIYQPSAASSVDRHYVRTANSNYLSSDFIYEISINYAHAQDLAFIGIGGASPTGINQVPTGLRLQLHSPPPNGFDGRLDFEYADNITDGLSFPGSVGFGYLTSYGPDRVRIIHSGDLLLCQIDDAYNGTFTSDFSYSIDLSQYPAIKSVLESDARPFFGGPTNGTTFDDFSVIVPEPGAMGFAATLCTIAIFRRRAPG